MALARGSQRLAFAVRALCKIIGNNPDVVNPDANPLRRAVYDSVTLACDLFDEFIPPRTPSGALVYAASVDTYTDGVVAPTNFDRSAGKYIVRITGLSTGPLFYAIRQAKIGVSDVDDMPVTDFLAQIENSWSLVGPKAANLHDFGTHATVVAAKRNVQGHLVDQALTGITLNTYTSTQPTPCEKPFVVTTVTYKDQDGKQDRILIPATYQGLGKQRFAGDPASLDAITAFIGLLAQAGSFLSTRAGGAAIDPVMAISTISNEKLYRRFFA